MLSKNYKNSAQVVDGKLILSFPGAVTPVVWQMDLLDVKASALEVNDNKDTGFDLVLKTLKGEAVHVASFEKKEDGVDGLMAASKALEQAQGRIVGQGQGAEQGASSFAARSLPVNGRGVFKGILLVVGALVVIVVLMNILASMTLSAGGGGTHRAERAAVATNAPVESGVPVSADDFLRKR